MTAVRSVDDFLADLDAVLDEADAPAAEPEPDPDAAAAMPDADPPLDAEEPPEAPAPAPALTPDSAPAAPAPAPRDLRDPLQKDHANPGSPQARPVSKAQTRLPDWWEPKPELTSPDEDNEAEDQEAQAEEEPAADSDSDNDDENDDADGQDDGTTPKKGWFTPQPGYWPRPTLPKLPARPALSDGTKRLIYNLSAAGAGYVWGPTQMIGDWIESCGRETSIGGALTLGAGICLGIAALWDCRTRHWKPAPLAWTARIPLASAITALALYAPASQI